MGHVIIGMDPHKRSATIEVIDERERVLGTGRFGTDRDGYQQMLVSGNVIDLLNALPQMIAATFNLPGAAV